MKLNIQEKNMLADSIAKIEHHTSGEMIVAIFTKSSDYQIAHYRWGLILALVVSFLCYQLHLFEDAFYLLLILIPSFFAGFCLAFHPFFKNFILSDQEKTSQVNHKAFFEFHRNQLTNTQGRTGILIYLSLLEHQVIVLADHAIDQKVGKNYWDKIVSDLIIEIKNKKLVTGLNQAITNCGEQLAIHFPAETVNQNELPNHLITDL